MFFPYCHFRSASIHYPTFPVIIRLDRIIHAAKHHSPRLLSSLRRIWPLPPGAADRNISNSDCPIKSGNDTKGIKSGKDNKGIKLDEDIKGSKSDNNAKESQ